MSVAGTYHALTCYFINAKEILLSDFGVVAMSELFIPFECPPTLAKIAVRMADEGIPIRAIARSVGWPAEDLRPVLQEALSSGAILQYPREDWPAKTPREARTPAACELDENLILDGARGVYHTTPTEGRVLSLLLRRSECSKQQLHEAIDGQQAVTKENTQIKIVDVIICHLRKKFKQYGVPGELEIKTNWGHGYFIPREQRDAALRRFAEWLTGTPPAPPDIQDAA